MSFHKSARNDVEHPAGQSAGPAESTVLTLYDAVQIIEDDAPGDAQAAWQYIYESGAYRQLQGWYGRGVAFYLESGYIQR